MEWIHEPASVEPLDLTIFGGICPAYCKCFCVPPMKVAMIQDPD